MYIRATGNISPQKSFGHPPFLEELVQHIGNRLHCIEPDYKNFIDPKLIRRMSRIIKMGVAAAMECLQEAGVKNPDAIITGTAYGCMADTGIFLERMIEHKEELLNPTAFIQSTHNTIGAQIALLLQCNNYNNTFVHRGFSFENALLDGMMLLNEKRYNHVLIGAVDEITDTSHTVLTRVGLYRQASESSLDLLNPTSKGTIAGEGAAFFLLSHKSSSTDYASIDALHTFYKPDSQQEIEKQILSFLSAQSISLKEIDLIITGRNGDARHDLIFEQLQSSLFNHIATLGYKNLCGEYPTSTAFALWMAANIIKTQQLSLMIDPPVKKTIRKILVYNHYQNIHHSLLLVSAC